MRPSAPERVLIDGPAGKIELDINDPGGGRRGIALIAHPHPLMGGTAGEHFFHGRLHLLQQIVTQYCRK